MRPSADKTAGGPAQQNPGGNTPESGETPRVWALVEPGEAASPQVRALAGALGWGHTEITLGPASALSPPAPWPGAAPRCVRGASPALSAPWPDLVIAGGARGSAAARWLRARAGTRTRLVQLGHPGGPLTAFDLVVATPFPGAAAHSNVLTNLLPLNPLITDDLSRAAWLWRDGMAHLARPRVACVVGGRTATHTVDVATAQRLARHADALARKAGGSVLLATRPGTPAVIAAAAQACLSAPHSVHRADADSAGEQAHTACLALADRLVMSGEGLDGLATACATGKPTHVVPAQPRLLARLDRLAARLDRRPSTRRRHRRVVEAAHDALVTQGYARWRDGALEVHTPPQGTADPLTRAVVAVRRMFGVKPGPPPHVTRTEAQAAARRRV